MTVAWQLKPVEKLKYKIYYSAQQRSVMLEQLLISEQKVDAALNESA